MEKFKNASECWKAILSDVNGKKHLLSQIKEFALNNQTPADIVFGTSGWRGEIGTDYTFNNVRIVTQAIIDNFKSGDREFYSAMGVKDYKDIQQRGVIVGHDNRFLGKEFAMEVIGLLQENNIKVFYAGEAITPEFSAGIEMTGCACSINLTPSHNPANFAGFKFNPSDGGPAGSEITSRFEKTANDMMKENKIYKSIVPKTFDTIDLTALYIQYITERKTIDLEKIKDFIKSVDLLVCIDNVHGASRGKVQRILGENPNIIYIRTEDDYLFGGIAPEPSEKNMTFVEQALAKSKQKFKLGVIIDPDGDRIRFSDGKEQIPMNYFGAMALHFLHEYKGLKGVVAKSVGTSNFVNAIAKKLNLPIKETKVGFKNFRPFMLKDSKERAIVAFEESDGISIYNHTLEKDSIIGLLLAIEMMATTGKNISDYLQEIMDKFGAFYPDRSGIGVDRSLAGKTLVDKLSSIQQMYPVGSEIDINGNLIKVKEVITVDGTKIILEDESWFMIRPSGTEPKVRFYIESRTLEGKKALFTLAEKITKEAIEK
ncbi:MAG: phosphomannomutase [Thermodesulfovibrionales bacterium]|nr:phosphomannomutase [Thermodesulfovibrionales bacterium]